jgi:hypothetical protein
VKNGWIVGKWGSPHYFLRGSRFGAPEWTPMDQGQNRVAGHIFRHDPMLTTFQGAQCEAILISSFRGGGRGHSGSTVEML